MTRPLLGVQNKKLGLELGYGKAVIKTQHVQIVVDNVPVFRFGPEALAFTCFRRPSSVGRRNS